MGSERPVFAGSERPANGSKPFNLSTILHAKHTQSGDTSRNDRVQQIQATDKNDSPFRTAEQPAKIGKTLSGNPLPARKKPISITAKSQAPSSTRPREPARSNAR